MMNEEVVFPVNSWNIIAHSNLCAGVDEKTNGIISMKRLQVASFIYWSSINCLIICFM